MKLTTMLMTSIGLAGALFATSIPQANAADIDYPALFKTKIIKCYHGTAKTESAVVEKMRDTATENEIATTLFKVYYEGIIKKNSMDIKVLVRQSGSIRQFKTQVLADTGTAHVTPCDFEKNWTDF